MGKAVFGLFRNVCPFCLKISWSCRRVSMRVYVCSGGICEVDPAPNPRAFPRVGGPMPPFSAQAGFLLR